MQNTRIIYFNLLIISAVVICLEIISTRISSVIFVNNYAFMILSLAILGLGSGGVYSFYRIYKSDGGQVLKSIGKSVLFTAISLIVFILLVILLEITNPLIYFFLLFFPFFFSGIAFALIFKSFADKSFKIYAFDLAGAACGSVLVTVIFLFLRAPNAILFLAIILSGVALSFLGRDYPRNKVITLVSVLSVCFVFVIVAGNKIIIGEIPIGIYTEKDYHFVYENQNVKSEIIDSRWSIHGRSDLVQYDHQDFVKQLFVDGAAGTQMYRFNGDVNNPGGILSNLLIHHSTSIPFMLLKEEEKNNMLVIGPGAGKEVLVGLLLGVENITGVEINSDFVEIVKDHRKFNGGIYTDFPNIKILAEEGRHFIKKTESNFDLIVMALPSTEQLQSIDSYAMSENYLLTVEAMKDYLKILTPEGRLILTVHNRWELIRLIVTAFHSFEEIGVSIQQALNHFLIFADDYSPTIVIKKNAFSEGEILSVENKLSGFKKDIPQVTYLPYRWERIKNSIENRFLHAMKNNQLSLDEYVKNDQFDISPVKDDSPYFYKVKRGVPSDYLWLMIGIIVVNILMIFIPYIRIKNQFKKSEKKTVFLSLKIFISLGLGFMILEISLFQKLILYLGTSTIALSILLGSLLIGMGIGSYFGKGIVTRSNIDRIKIISIMIVLLGIIVFTVYPVLLNKLLIISLFWRAIICFILLVPFGFLLGIPFPSAVLWIKQNNLEKYIPWMYGINGTMSVLGSVLAGVLSMLLNFTFTFFIGLLFYFYLSLMLWRLKTK